jgi:hypothetical protein
MTRKLPKDGSIRRKRAFAWLPMKTDDGYNLWLDYYTRVERYWGFINTWELQECLYDGPAVELTNGDKYWYLNGQLHREYGPAVERSNGDKEWWLNGKCHCEDGPAVERSNGDKYWYLNGECLTEEEFNKRMTPTVEMTMAEISEALGKNVKVVK